LKKWPARLAPPPPWPGGPGARGFAEAYAQARKKILTNPGRHPVVVAERHPAAYLAAVLAAVEGNRAVVLANTQWGEGERTQAAGQIAPGLWLGAKSTRWPKVKAAPRFDAKKWQGAIFIPTGGTGGRVRWAGHTWSTLAAAAQALARFLSMKNCVHVSTLPPWHVSGLMPAVRAWETGGRLWLENWKALEAGRPPKIPPTKVIISLVPTQLQRLLAGKAVVRWLQGTQAILLGGAAPSPELLERARQLRLPIALAYGMTETAAVVAAQRPKDFLAGQPMAATALPHAKVWVGDETGQRRRLGCAGRLWIQAESLFYGYYPAQRKKGPWATEDWGVADARGRVKPLRRMDRVIITGGEKVHPAEVEEAISATGLVSDVRVVGLPDGEWGERVVAIYTGRRHSGLTLQSALAGRLAKASLPKAWIWTKKLPVGKVIS
jgi:O-succinylbenzoic acid--CoA ligase